MGSLAAKRLKRRKIGMRGAGRRGVFGVLGWFWCAGRSGVAAAHRAALPIWEVAGEISGWADLASAGVYQGCLRTANGGNEAKSRFIKVGKGQFGVECGIAVPRFRVCPWRPVVPWL